MDLSDDVDMILQKASDVQENVTKACLAWEGYR